MASRLSIQPQAASEQTLSAAQKKFNALIRKIELQRQQLADWELAVPHYQQRRDAAFGPLLADHRALNLELVQFLDRTADQPGFGKADRETLHELIADLATGLMDSAQDGAQRDAMKALYNKHSGGDFDAEQRKSQDALKAMVQAEYGVALDDDAEHDTPEALLRRVQQKLQADEAARAEAKAHKQATRKKTARQLAQDHEEKQVGQSVREVYRKLASALHPDRELDPEERARKTALMQRVNQAYAANKLLDLLQLQLEVEQIDPGHMANVGEDRLKRYNRVLGEQLAELEQEMLATEHGLKSELGMHPLDTLTPLLLMGRLRAQLKQLTHDIYHLRRERASLDDPKQLKRWLKAQRRQAQAWDGFPDGLSDLFR